MEERTGLANGRSLNQVGVPVSGLRAHIARGRRSARAVAAKVVKALDSSVVAGAAASAHNTTTMATVVTAMDAEFRTPLDAANQARQAAQASPEQAARQA